jgi:ferric-dicitrate binding protein FerR (iron transport regulator)
MNEDIDIILSRYFSGEITEKENQILDDWLAKSEENDTWFQQMSWLYQYSGKVEEIQTVDTNKAWAKFNRHISEKPKNRRFFIASHTLKIAAAVAVLLVSVFALLYFLNQPSKINRLMAAATPVEYKIFDHTNVTLFPNAELIYNSSKENEITLKGKATFTVDSKTSVGIVVQVGETFIKDIGTVFTVDATQPDKSITVEVTEGEVLFYTDINSGIYVKRDEKAIYDVKTKEFNMIVETRHETSLQEIIPDIVFHNTPLLDAVNMIKAKYGIDILINPEVLNEICLNATFDASEPVENVLEIIVETIGAKLTKKGTTYVIY